MSIPIHTRLARGAACVALALVGACASSTPPIAAHRGSVVLSASEQQISEAFEAQVKDYMALHRKLAATLPKLSKNATGEQIDTNQRALGELVKNARANAARGEFFTPQLQALVKRTLAAVMAGPDGANTRGSILDENPGVANLSVNDRYPDAIPLSTMPPQVLESLPELADDLEYRFIGERLTLMDPSAHIIIDFTDDVLP